MPHLSYNLELMKFLSTPSARRATGMWSLGNVINLDFYPRPPRGGRRLLGPVAPGRMKFLSTPSARRATSVCFRCIIKV